MSALPPELDRAALDVLRHQYEVTINDAQLFNGIVNALEAMSPEGRIVALKRLARALPPTHSDQADRPRLTREQTNAIDTDFSTLTYGDAVEALFHLMASRRPLSTKLLLGRLQTVGKAVNGKDPYRILYRTLRKDPRFVNISGQWALAEWYEQEPSTDLLSTAETETEHGE